MKTNRIHQARIMCQFALLGSVIAGAFFGNLEDGDTYRMVGAMSMMLIAKFTYFA